MIYITGKTCNQVNPMSVAQDIHYLLLLQRSDAFLFR